MARKKRPSWWSTRTTAQKRKIVQRISEWRRLNPEKCRAYKAKYRNLNREKIRAANVMARIRLREKFFSMYGDRCDLCKTDRRIVLTIDHVGGGGNAEKRSLGSRTSNFHVYKKATKRLDRKRYRTLCFNCQYEDHHGRAYAKIQEQALASYGLIKPGGRT
jgi:hypothetical protein